MFLTETSITNPTSRPAAYLFGRIVAYVSDSAWQNASQPYDMLSVTLRRERIAKMGVQTSVRYHRASRHQTCLMPSIQGRTRRLLPQGAFDAVRSTPMTDRFGDVKGSEPDDARLLFYLPPPTSPDVTYTQDKYLGASRDAMESFNMHLEEPC